MRLYSNEIDLAFGNRMCMARTRYVHCTIENWFETNTQCFSSNHNVCTYEAKGHRKPITCDPHPQCIYYYVRNVNFITKPPSIRCWEITALKYSIFSLGTFSYRMLCRENLSIHVFFLNNCIGEYSITCRVSSNSSYIIDDRQRWSVNDTCIAYVIVIVVEMLNVY